MIQILPSMYNGYVCPTDPGEPGTGQPRLSVNDDEARLLAVLASSRFVLEIGTGLGVSTRALASTADHVHTVDIDPWVQRNLFPFLPHNVDCYNDLASLPPGVSYGMAFIDGLHTEEQVTADIEAARRMLADGAFIVLHDTLFRCIQAAIRNSGMAHTIMQTRAGMAVLWP